MVLVSSVKTGIRKIYQLGKKNLLCEMCTNGANLRDSKCCYYFACVLGGGCLN